jgi:2-dehydropantoate 2-reductase
MRLLIYGAGNIGCLYAAKLAQSGNDVAILARGHRHDALRDHGITLEDGVSGERTTTAVAVVDRLDPEDAYDLVLVVLPKPALAEVLPILAKNVRTPTVLFFGNNAAGPAPMISALGVERVLLGFPGAAAIPGDDAIRYVITSRREQPTTIGELGGGHTERIAAIVDALEAAGFPASTCANMDAWLKTHVAKILPTAGALFYAGGLEQLAENREALRLMVRGMREGLDVLRANDIPITPVNHKAIRWLPESLLVFAMKRMLGVDTMEIKIGHAEHARRELQLLATELRALNATTRVPTPALDRLLDRVAVSEVHDLAS